MAADLIIRFIGDTKEFNAKVASANRKLGEFGTSSSKTSKLLHGLGTVGAIGLGAVATGAIAVGAESIKMAATFQVAHAKLVTALKNTNTSFDAQKQKIDDAETASRKLGFTDTEVETALAQMTIGMGSSTKALANLKLAQDLSAASGKDLTTSALAITKASEGQLRPLKQLGIDLPIAAANALKVKKAQDSLASALTALSVVQDKIHQGFIKGPAAIFAYEAATNKVHTAQSNLSAAQLSGTQILDALSGKLAGSAAAAADTFAGKQKVLKAEADHLQVEIGQKLLPVLIGVENWIIKDGIPAMTAFGNTIISVGDNIGRVASNIAQWTQNTANFFDGLSSKLNSVSGAITGILGSGGGTGVLAGSGGDLVLQNGKWIPRALADYNNSHFVVSNKSSPHFTNAPSTGRAIGGPVGAGMTYTVGEHGPETLVMGRTSGTVIPHGGGVNVYATVYVGTHDDGDQIVNKIVRSLKKGTGVREIQRALAQ